MQFPRHAAVDVASTTGTAAAAATAVTASDASAAAHANNLSKEEKSCHSRHCWEERHSYRRHVVVAGCCHCSDDNMGASISLEI